MWLGMDMHIIPRNMCTKFQWKMSSYEVRFKFFDDNADDAKGITLARFFLWKITDKLKFGAIVLKVTNIQGKVPEKLLSLNGHMNIVSETSSSHNGLKCYFLQWELVCTKC